MRYFDFLTGLWNRAKKLVTSLRFMSFYDMLAWYPENVRSLLLTGLLGLAAGLTAVGFLIGTHYIFRITYLTFATWSTVGFLAGSFAVIVGSSLLVGFLLTFASKEAAGSGIPQLKVSYWRDCGVMRWRTVWVKLIAGMLSIGGGASLGREGPTIFVASGVASNLASKIGLPRERHRFAVATGAAAGLAGAFNTPLAAITFVLEELIGDLNSRFLGSVVLSSVVGAFTVYWIVGKQPAFILPDIQWPTWYVYILVPVVAGLAGLLGISFQRAALALRYHVRQRSRVTCYLRPLIGGLATWCIGAAIFINFGRLGIFGLGYDDLSATLTGHLDWRLAGLLVVGKMAASVCCYGWEGCGGIFAPTLFLGGLAGYFIAGGAAELIPMTTSDQTILAVVGMSACFGAVVRVPLTALLMIFEMTHQFSMVPSLMIGTLVSLAVAKMGSADNFYDSLLKQDGHELTHVSPPQDLTGWHNLPISTFANAIPVVIHDLSSETIQDVLTAYSFRYFPVNLQPNRWLMVSRDALIASLADNRPPTLDDAILCDDATPIRTVIQEMIRSPHGLALIRDSHGTMTRLITRHDLLRNQMSLID